jgi:hypothetical protein
MEENMADYIPVKADNTPDKVDLETINSFILADSIVYKTYLENINNMAVVPCPTEIKNLELNDIARFFRVERFVSEKNENNRDKLISVFHAVASCGGSVLVLIHSDGKKVNYYFGTKAFVKQNPDILDNSAKALEKTLKGNFPGTKIMSVRKGHEIDELKNIFPNIEFEKQEKHICTITGVAGLRSKEESFEKLFIQGIEKLVDSMQGEKYSMLLIADPVSQEQINIVKQGYENLYSQLFPFASNEISYDENESVSNSLTEGFSKSISESVTDSLTYTKGSFSSHTHTSSDSNTIGVSQSFKSPLSLIPGIGKFFGKASVNASRSHTESDSYTTGTNKSIAEGKANTKGEVNTTIEQETEQKTEGTSKGLQIKFENKTIKNLLEKIDLQLKRLDACRDTGMWNCSVYCLSDVASVCKITASAYQSILRGENSSIESGTVTEWSKQNAIAIISYLEKMHHPVLKLTDDMEVTPSSLISTSELTIHAGIPQTSVSGLPVLETAAFGREVSAHWESGKKPVNNESICLGNIYHMGSEEELPVSLDKNSLASHTFITGSTGSGKSNTVYKLLGEAIKSKCHFLVIEPAKGEYKNVFGNKPDVSVYGTNPALTSLLRINPFAFPNGNEDPSKNIHILEHLDRLIEIFNVCWPMYAAMPAVLKDAIEVSYEEKGWDLPSSTNVHAPAKYPTFADITVSIRKIIDNSEYSDENKGNYKGSLITRLKSLTNGINGMIFTEDELSNEELFDKNVIADLSRVGSTETKALIMGILIMKLQEYRQTSGKMNAELQHITVLEEAHNLLKRTSTEQTSETANLLGKSVEMLANAIAEMRTYGEGFIIADQSPGLMDMSVIRNTNTKIILRLPGESDRVLVGKSAGLNDDQIVELTKLQCGVAAIYQNNWIQPVLCKVEEYKDFDKNFIYQKPDTGINKKTSAVMDLKKYAFNNAKIDKVKLKEKIEAVDFESFKSLDSPFIASLFQNNKRVFNAALKIATKEKTGLLGLKNYLLNHLEPSLSNYEAHYCERILTCIVLDNCMKDPELIKLPEMWSDFITEKEAYKDGRNI